ERRLRSPFLAHEQHRHAGREQRDRQRGLDRARIGMGFEPVAERAIADLVVVLQEIDKGGWPEFFARFAARPAVAMRRWLTLIGKAGAERAGDVVARRAAIVAVVAV